MELRPLLRSFDASRRVWRHRLLDLVRDAPATQSPTDPGLAAARDYLFLRRALAARRELTERYELERPEKREMDKARDAAARVGLALPKRAE